MKYFSNTRQWCVQTFLFLSRIILITLFHLARISNFWHVPFLVFSAGRGLTTHKALASPLVDIATSLKADAVNLVYFDFDKFPLFSHWMSLLYKLAENLKHLENLFWSSHTMRFTITHIFYSIFHDTTYRAFRRPTALKTNDQKHHTTSERQRHYDRTFLSLTLLKMKL